MASSLNDTSRNLMLDALGAVAGFASLHTASPGSGGSNEVSGGSPAYARKACAWNAASGGAGALSSNVVFDVPAGTTVTYISCWNTAGTVRYFKKSVTSEAFGAQGTYTVLAASTSIDLNDA